LGKSLFETQKSELKTKVTIVSPEHLASSRSFKQKGTFKLDSYGTWVIDEADEM